MADDPRTLKIKPENRTYVIDASPGSVISIDMYWSSIYYGGKYWGNWYWSGLFDLSAVRTRTVPAES